MAHFAKLDRENIVLEVHVVHNNELLDEDGNEVEQRGINFLVDWCNGTHSNWKQTSYNGSFRKNYAGIGYMYDELRDAFIPPKPYPSWILDDDTCRWTSPVPYPSDGKSYSWHEETATWIEIETSE